MYDSIFVFDNSRIRVNISTFENMFEIHMSIKMPDEEVLNITHILRQNAHIHLLNAHLVMQEEQLKREFEKAVSEYSAHKRFEILNARRVVYNG